MASRQAACSCARPNSAALARATAPKAGDGGDSFGAGPATALLRPAAPQRLDLDPRAQNERSGALQTAELVRRKRHEIKAAGVEGQPPSDLHGVDMKQRPGLGAERTHPGERLHHAGFIVGGHDADERRLGRAREFRGEIVEIDEAVALHIDHHGHGAAPLGEPHGREADAFVLGGEDEKALEKPRLAGAEDGEGVRFRSAAREDDAFWRGADKRRDVFARTLDERPSAASRSVHGGSVRRHVHGRHAAARASGRTGAVAL